MKKKTNFAILVCSIALFSCSQENTEKISEQSLSLDNDRASNVTAMTHVFDATKLKDLLESQNMLHFHFKMEFNNQNKIKNVEAVGLTTNHQEFGSVMGVAENRSINLEQLQNMESITEEEITNQGAALARHIIQPQTASRYINDWNIIINSNEFMANYIEYNNERIQYYLIEKEVIASIVEKENIQKAAIFWGLNAEGKLTPVFIGIDDLDRNRYDQSRSEYILDTSLPIPPLPPSGCETPSS